MIFRTSALIFANLSFFLVKAAHFDYDVVGIKGLNPENDPIYDPITGRWTLNTEMDPVYCPKGFTKSKSCDSSNEYYPSISGSSGISSNNSPISIVAHLNFSYSKNTPKPIDRQRFPDDDKTWGAFWGYPQDISEPVTWFRHLGQFKYECNEGKMCFSTDSVISLITHPYANFLTTTQTFYSMQYIYVTINKNFLFRFLFDISLKVFRYVTNDIVTALVIENLPNNFIKVNFIINRRNEAKLNCPVKELLRRFSSKVSGYKSFSELKRY